jgi:hypothetical protein
LGAKLYSVNITYCIVIGVILVLYEEEPKKPDEDEDWTEEEDWEDEE